MCSIASIKVVYWSLLGGTLAFSYRLFRSWLYLWTLKSPLVKRPTFSSPTPWSTFLLILQSYARLLLGFSNLLQAVSWWAITELDRLGSRDSSNRLRIGSHMIAASVVVKTVARTDAGLEIWLQGLIELSGVDGLQFDLHHPYDQNYCFHFSLQALDHLHQVVH